MEQIEIQTKIFFIFCFISQNTDILTFFLFILTNEESEFNLNKKTLDSIYSLKVKPKIIETIYTKLLF